MPASPPSARRGAIRRPIARLASLAAPFAAVLLGAACGSSFVVPTPPLATAAAPLAPAPAAVLALPVTLRMSALATQLEAGFAPEDSLDRRQCQALLGSVCHQYVYHRDPLDLTMRDDRLTMRTQLRYRGRVAVPRVGGLASCGYGAEPPRRANLSLATVLYWRSDWRVGVRDTELGARLVDPCRVTLLNVDAAPLMQRVVDAQLDRVTAQLDSIVPTLADLRPAADSLWRSMQEPVALDSAESAWLVMNPERVSLAPLVGGGNIITTAVVVLARPRVHLGARPQVAVRPLPALVLVPPARGLRVPVDVELPFADLSRRMTAMLAGETAGDGLRVRTVSVWGAGDTVAVKLDLEGKLAGSLYLVGRFAYDAPARQLRLDDLRYTLASESAMSRLKATLGAPLIRRALNDATGGGRLDLGAQLDSVRYQLTQRLNGPLAPGMSVGGGVHDMRVLGVHTTGSAFVVRVMLEGNAELYVQ